MRKILNIISDKMGFKIDQSVFEKNQEEIQKANVSLLRQLAFAACIFAVFLFSVNFMFPGTIQNTNMCFLIMMLSVILFALTYIAYNPLLPYAALLIYFMSTVMLACSAIMGIYETPDLPAVMFVVILAVFPMQVIDKQTHVVPFTVAVWAVFCIAELVLKERRAAMCDVMYASVALTLGILLNRQVIRARLSAINDKRILSRHTQIDSITGLPNYKKFNEDLSGKNDSRIAKSLCSLAMFDIDGFMDYNTKYGRDAGDKCLKKIGNCFIKISDPGELIIYRYSGTSFAAVSLVHDYKGIERVCKGVLALVRNLNIEFQGSPKGIITMSAGYTDVVECECDEFSKMVDMANEAIKFARAEGGNQEIGYLQLKNHSKA